MRRFLTLVLGGLGLGLGTLLRRRRRHRPDELVPDPAEALRSRLAETRTATDEEAGTVGESPERSPLDPQSRRETVHERARQAIDDLGT